MRTITIYRHTYIWEVDAEEPTYDEPTSETIECEPDRYDCEDGLTAVDLAYEALSREGIGQPSSAPTWSKGTWYSYWDNPVNDYGTGEMEEATAHLEGFSDDESRELYARITRN